MLNSLSIYFHGDISQEQAQEKLNSILADVEGDITQDVICENGHLVAHFQTATNTVEAKQLGEILSALEPFSFSVQNSNGKRPEWVLLSKRGSQDITAHLIKNAL